MLQIRSSQRRFGSFQTQVRRSVFSDETRGSDGKLCGAAAVTAPRSPMKAETLNCPNCGAAVSPDSPRCQFCESKLATVACPSCFAMMFIGSRHCPHCGAAAADTKASALSTLKCPRCKSDMLAITLGGSAMRECESCGGLWLEVAAFERLCADREDQSSVLGMPSP